MSAQLFLHNTKFFRVISLFPFFSLTTHITYHILNFLFFHDCKKSKIMRHCCLPVGCRCVWLCQICISHVIAGHVRKSWLGWIVLYHINLCLLHVIENSLIYIILYTLKISMFLISVYCFTTKINFYIIWIISFYSWEKFSWEWKLNSYLNEVVRISSIKIPYDVFPKSLQIPSIIWPIL